MLSYNWGHQHIVKKIASTLKEIGYNVWVDYECIGGSVLDASTYYLLLSFNLLLDLFAPFINVVADAVENAEVVLLCVSQKYKDSPNCRFEGEYVVQRKVSFIPLMMQDNYCPDGWYVITTEIYSFRLTL